MVEDKNVDVDEDEDEVLLRDVEVDADRDRVVKAVVMHHRGVPPRRQ